MGRPEIIISEEQIGQIELMAAAGDTIDEIAEALNLSNSEFRNKKRENAAINNAYKRGRRLAKHSVVKSLMKQIRDGNTAATIFWLKTQAGWTTDIEKAQMKELNAKANVFKMLILDIIAKHVKSAVTLKAISDDLKQLEVK